MLGTCELTCGLVAPFLCMIAFRAPLSVCMMGWRSRLSFWILIAPTLVLAPPYALLVYVSLSDFKSAHPLAEMVAGLQIPGVVL
jgi:hypothetical protein